MPTPQACVCVCVWVGVWVGGWVARWVYPTTISESLSTCSEHYAGISPNASVIMASFQGMLVWGFATEDSSILKDSRVATIEKSSIFGLRALMGVDGQEEELQVSG
jgi:hypothetical protein